MKRKDQCCLQGSISKKRYFEGWYYKFVTEDKKTSLAVIVGISTEDPHAFLQIAETKTQKSYYIRYGLDEIEFQDKPFSITIGGNYFSKEEVILDIEKKDLSLHGHITFSDMTPFQPSFLTPTVMGIFSYLPMKCSHGIVSMHHDLEGSVKYQDETIDFEDGYGYIEKDYGTSFPKEYVWAQSNTPLNESKYKKVSVMLSIADIPFVFFNFQGFLAVVQLDDKQYLFTTYNRTKLLEYRQKRDIVTLITFRRGIYELSIRMKPGKSLFLRAPKEGRMKNTIQESLNGTMKVTLKKDGSVIFKETMCAVGIEKVKTES